MHDADAGRHDLKVSKACMPHHELVAFGVVMESRPLLEGIGSSGSICTEWSTTKSTGTRAGSSWDFFPMRTTPRMAAKSQSRARP